MTRKLTIEERNKVASIISELQSRNLSIPDEYKLNKKISWSLDPDGYFVRLDGRRFSTENVDAVNFYQSNARFTALISGRGGGKALAVDTPIPTVNGWKLMGDIVVGDIVFDEKGNQTTVISTSPVMYNHECYLVVFSDESQIIADAEHEWKVYSKYANSYKIINTKSLYSRKLKSGNNYNYLVDVAEAVLHDSKQLPIHPYVLGAWLGDGSSREAKITCGNDDHEILKKIISLGYPIHPVSEPMSYSLGSRKGHKNEFQATLRAIGVLKNKRIPRIYLESSKDQRLELLRGLMDTDGSISRKGHCCFDNQNYSLIEDVYELISSLGIKSTIKRYDAKLCGVKTGVTYKIAFTPTMPVFSLPRKLKRQKYRKQFYRRGVMYIQPLESLPVKCIRVDAKSHLFLAGKSFIPTHNSAAGSQKALLKIREGKSGAVLNPDF